MRLNFGNWAVAMCLAALVGLGALYTTRPAAPTHSTSSQPMVGRDHPSAQSPEPFSADEIGYQVPRDKIRAVGAPTFLKADQAGFVPDRMSVIGVATGDEAKAYPVPVLSRVEIVNDQLAGRAIAVTW